MKRVCVNLNVDGGTEAFWLSTPTPYGMEQQMRLLLDADADLDPTVPDYTDPEAIEAEYARLSALPREQRRELRDELAAAKADAERVSAMTADERKAAQRNANRVKLEAGIMAMTFASASLAALLSDRPDNKDAAGRPLHVYTREEAARMIPMDEYATVREAIESLWPSGSSGEAGGVATTPTTSTTP